MRTSLIIFICSLSIIVFGEDYRSFSAKDGRTISAKIIKIDKQAMKVTLERKNKKKSTVPINIFSAPDQAYISSWASVSSDREKEPAKETQHLSKDRIKEIAEQYEERKNQGSWSISEGSPIYRYIASSRIVKKKVNAGSILDNGFEVKLSLTWIPDDRLENDSGGHTFTDLVVLITPEGMIKYDSIQDPHPVELATVALANLVGFNFGTTKEADLEVFVSLIKESGVPLFGLEVGSDKEKSRGSALEIIEWLLDNGTSFDATQPNVFYPSNTFGNLKKSLVKTKIKL